jgi:hypothetical protein
MSLEMAQKVIVPQKKNYVPQFLKQRDINSYRNIVPGTYGPKKEAIANFDFGQSCKTFLAYDHHAIFAKISALGTLNKTY